MGKIANRKLIYLDDAINALERKKDKKAKGDIGGFYNKIIQNDIDALMQLPSAQPERVKATLINPNPYGLCSECDYLIDMRDGFNFCPNCGADMRGEQDE